MAVLGGFARPEKSPPSNRIAGFSRLRAARLGVAMEQHHQPTKEEIREWLREVVESHKPPPDLDVIRGELWPLEERDRKQVMS